MFQNRTVLEFHFRTLGRHSFSPPLYSSGSLGYSSTTIVVMTMMALLTMVPAVLILVAATAPVRAFGPQNSDPLAAALEALQVQHAALLEETAAAQSQGVPVHYERATLALAEYFATVATADNTTASQALLQKQYAAFYKPSSMKGFAHALAAALPVREANDTVHVLQRARAALAVAAGAGRPPLPSRNLIDGALCDGYFCNADGAPVFSTGFNTWLARKTPRVAPFDPVPTGVTQETVGFLIKWGLQANLTWTASTLAANKLQLDAAAAINQTVFALMGQSMPNWAEAMYPGLNTGNFTSHGVSFDIDNPGASVVSTAGIHAWLDAIGCHRAFGGWILANEPDFRASQTPHTMRKYHAWLEQRYHGAIAALNTAWGTGFSSFAGIASPPAYPSPDPSEPLLLGGPVSQPLRAPSCTHLLPCHAPLPLRASLCHATFVPVSVSMAASCALALHPLPHTHTHTTTTINPTPLSPRIQTYPCITSPPQASPSSPAFFPGGAAGCRVVGLELLQQRARHAIFRHAPRCHPQLGPKRAAGHGAVHGNDHQAAGRQRVQGALGRRH
jgi:hypothetical protein